MSSSQAEQISTAKNDVSLIRINLINLYIKYFLQEDFFKIFNKSKSRPVSFGVFIHNFFLTFSILFLPKSMKEKP